MVASFGGVLIWVVFCIVWFRSSVQSSIRSNASHRLTEREIEECCDFLVDETLDDKDQEDHVRGAQSQEY